MIRLIRRHCDEDMILCSNFKCFFGLKISDAGAKTFPKSSQVVRAMTTEDARRL